MVVMQKRSLRIGFVNKNMVYCETIPMSPHRGDDNV